MFRGALVLCLGWLFLSGWVLGEEAEWQAALPGWKYVFPRDHGSHPEFKTEWWYCTGNLESETGRRFGYQLTLFRQGTNPRVPKPGQSRFVIHDLKFAHFAFSDEQGQCFEFEQKLSRGAFGEAGFGSGNRLAWIEDWQLELGSDEQMKLRASKPGIALELELRNLKPWVMHGENGISQKAEGLGHASHYYSGTRMESIGRLVLGREKFSVRGLSWFDHEWATNQLTPEQIGWNWFSLQFADGSELMLYQMRLRNGGIDPSSSGTWILADGSSRFLKAEAYELKPGKAWKSPQSGGEYPIAWSLRVPDLELELEVSTPLINQELFIPPIAYWEGMIEVNGRRAGQPVRGRGYMELTGYAGPLVGLSVPEISAKAPAKR